MSKIHDVTKWAGVLRGVTTAAMVVLPVAITVGVFTAPSAPDALNNTFALSPDATQWQLSALMVLNLISPIILIWVLNEMRKLFGSYQKGEILTHESARLIQRIGQGFLTLAILRFVVRPIQSVLSTMANAPGERSITIGFDSDMIFFALCGGLIIVIGWAMREASDAASENRSFV